jgi:MFS family permease
MTEVRPVSLAASAEAEVPPGGRRPGLLSPLRQRSFALYFAGQLLSQIGDGIFLVALPFIVLGAGFGPTGLGLVLACYGIARVVAFPVGGTLADGLGSRRVMLGADVLRAVVMVGFALLVLVEHPPLWTLIGTVVLLGSLDGIFMPASYAALPEIVPKEHLGAGNSLTSTMHSVATFAGPAAGGPLMANLRSSVSLLVNAATFLASTVTLFAIRRYRVSSQPAEAPAPDTASRSWKAVLRYLVGSPLLKMALLVTLVANLAYAGMIEVALPSFSITPLGRGVAGYGTIMAGFGLGSTLGALCGPALLRVRRRGLLALIIGIGQGVAIMCVPVGSSLVVATGAMVLAAGTQGMLNVFYLTMLQTEIPPGYLGRTMGLLVTAAGIAFPASTLLAGMAVRGVGPAVVIVAGGASISLAFLLGFGSRRFRNL